MERFDLFDDCDQIRVGKLEIVSGNAVVSNVGRNVLVMGKGRGKCGIFGMGKVIVPIQAFYSSINFVSIRCNQTICKIQFFPHSQTDSVCKSRLTFSHSGKGTG